MDARFAMRLSKVVMAAGLRLLGRTLRTRVGLVCLALCGALFGVRSCGTGPALRVGTFNIEKFGQRTNLDLAELTTLLSSADRDVLALQEIQDAGLLQVLAAQLSARTGRRYQSVLSQCGGRSQMHVGFLYDAERLRLEGTHEFPEMIEDRSGNCSTGDRAGLLATFSLGRWFSRRSYSLLVVHFPALGTPQRAAERRVFWQRALGIARRFQKGGAERLLLLGDVNSTGYLDNSHNERDNIHSYVEGAGLKVLTPHLGCTAYWLPEGGRAYSASHLDHIIASEAVAIEGPPRVLGYCPALKCAPVKTMPKGFHSVSDHCPVVVELR